MFIAVHIWWFNQFNRKQMYFICVSLIIFLIFCIFACWIFFCIGYSNKFVVWHWYIQLTLYTLKQMRDFNWERSVYTCWCVWVHIKVYMDIQLEQSLPPKRKQFHSGSQTMRLNTCSVSYGMCSHWNCFILLVEIFDSLLFCLFRITNEFLLISRIKCDFSSENLTLYSLSVWQLTFPNQVLLLKWLFLILLPRN